MQKEVTFQLSNLDCKKISGCLPPFLDFLGCLLCPGLDVQLFNGAFIKRPAANFTDYTAISSYFQSKNCEKRFVYLLKLIVHHPRSCFILLQFSALSRPTPMSLVPADSTMPSDRCPSNTISCVLEAYLIDPCEQFSEPLQQSFYLSMNPLVHLPTFHLTN